MKPLKLRLQAFGSFPGLEEIDFDALGQRGLFVVSGNTGTGKTTIFDAMCWALYGKMPLKESGGVRSDHAGADTETFVELTFECDGVRHVVTRRPEHLRPSKRGGGLTTEPASAGLVRLTEDGSEPLSTRATDTSSRCAALVGLDAEQFQRVVLLPQGEFARFLLAETKERESLLGTLFGGQVFDDMVDYLKIHRNELASQLQAVEADIKAQLESARENLGRVHEALGIDVPGSLGYAPATPSDPGASLETQSGPESEAALESEPAPDVAARDVVATADREQLSSIREAVTGPLEQIQAQVADLKRRAEAASKTHSDAEAAAGRFDETLRQLHAIAKLELEESQVAEDEAAAHASKDARPVTTEATALAGARKREAGATKARDEHVKEIVEALGGLDVQVDTSSATTITAALEDFKGTCEKQAGMLHAHREAAEACEKADRAHSKAETELTTKVEARGIAAARVKKIEEVELRQLREQSADPVTIQTKIDTATRSIRHHSALAVTLAALSKAREAEESAASVHVQVFKAFVATQAPRMAEGLIDGEPCPVCGSADHPAPASSDGGTTTSSVDLETAAGAQRQAASAVGDLEAKVAGMRVELGDDAGVSVEELKAKRADLEATLEAANELAARIGALEQELTHVQKQVQQLETQIEGLRVTRVNAEEQLREAEKMLAGAAEAVEGIDAAEVGRGAEVLATLSDRAVGLEGSFIAAAEARSSVAVCDERLELALAQSNFSTVEEASAALLSLEEEKERLDAAQRHRTRRQDADTALEILDQQGVPDERPDLERTEQEKYSAREAYDHRHRACTTATNNAEYCDTALGRHDSLVSGSGSVRVEHERAELAHAVCNTGGALYMSLKRWVLTRELDRVTAAANVHLRNMTAHRYSLQRRCQVTDARKNFGLDLEVLDATTGRPRSTTTLSGGEQFQASLALALGLADVVSHGGSASGKRFEALFVDEGFGSLDPQALDDAIDALHQLHSTGRMVGAITHVEAMKHQLHVGIAVKRLPDGGGSTLVVNP